MAQVMDGHILSEKIKENVKNDVEKLRQYGIDVGLGLLLFGENPASKQYFLAIVRGCKKVGITTYEYNVPENVSINEVLNIIHAANRDERINGLLVLLPLPGRINARRVVNEIIPEKDVDGLGSLSVGRLAADESTFQIFSELVDSDRDGDKKLFYKRELITAASNFLPCTPLGVIRLIEHYGIKIKGKHAVIVGKSLAVGKPLSLMFLAKEATVTVCHRETPDLGHFTRQADILCSATGVAGLIKTDMVKENAVVVDIGIRVLDNGKIVGDVDVTSVERKASHITPVPGGVGPVTIAMLLENTVRSAHRGQFMKMPLVIG